MKTKHRAWVYLFLLIFIVVNLVPLFLTYSPQSANYFLSQPAVLRSFLIDMGILGGVIFIGLMSLSIILPFPSTTFVVCAGYVYGLWLGTFLALVGLVIGSCATFLLVRRYGRPLLEKLVDAHHIQHFNEVFARRGPLAAFISYVVPVFPSDTVTILLGLTPISFRTFLLILILGHIPRYLILNGVGDIFQSGLSLLAVLSLIGATLLLVVVVFRHKVKVFFFKELCNFKVVASKRKSFFPKESTAKRLKLKK